MMGAAAGGGSWMMILIIVVLFVFMYFFMIRPQNKEQKRIREMLNSMEIGDAVVTSSGFYGVIIDITDEDVIVEFGNNRNCRIPMKKAAIAQLEKASAAMAPANDGKSKAKKEEKPAEKAAEKTEEKAEKTADSKK